MIFKPSFTNSDIPLSEYPRPQFKRDSYLPLNGAWQYEIVGINDQIPSGELSGEIVVPYSPESELSKVGRNLKKDQKLIYRRTFTLPQGFNRGRVLLNFGAVDQVCEVFVNRQAVGGHEGGYLPFTLDITSALLLGENELIVCVTDDADSDKFGRGKQKYKRGGIWYTATSGIWQSVWLESVPDQYIKSVRLSPDYDAKTLCVKAEVEGKNTLTIVVNSENGLLCRRDQNPSESVIFDVSACKPWSVSDPQLYSVKITYGEDEVESYFGLRKFSTVEINGKKYFALNGEPIFHNGLLDQGYYHDGLYTPRENKVMYDEIKAVKDLGFNMLRKHIKVEPMLWYYYCDALGILVWQDMINGGGAYSPIRIALCPFLNLNIDDTNYSKMKRNEQSREQYYKEAYGLIDTLYNCVSLCLWTPFNEAWGQFDAYKVWKELSAYDQTRLFDHASGWQDKGGGDVNSKHVYFRKARIKSDGKRVLALTEFGGYSYELKGHVFSDKKFGYKLFSSAEKLTTAIEKLYKNEVIPLIKEQGLCATVYTELTDVENEINGLFTFDRALKVDAEAIKSINRAVEEAFSAVVSERKHD